MCKKYNPLEIPRKNEADWVTNGRALPSIGHQPLQLDFRKHENERQVRICTCTFAFFFPVFPIIHRSLAIFPDFFEVIFSFNSCTSSYWNEIIKQDCNINFSESLSEEELEESFFLKLRKPSGDINTEFLYCLYSKVTSMMGMKFGTF